MQLQELISELTSQPDIGSLEVAHLSDDMASLSVTDVVHDSRRVAANHLFCAVPGLTVDGHDYVASAVDSGASAVLVERVLNDGPAASVAQIVVPSVRQGMAHAAAIVHGQPSSDMALFGITGTNGKTTTTHLLADIMRSQGAICSVIGTLDGVHTTPESTDLQRHLRTLADEGSAVVALEVSSHALDQHRVDATTFAVGAFSNLTPDHLDYHVDMESYFEAKARLFDGRSAAELINHDDPWGAKLAARRPNAHTVSLNSVEIRAEHLDRTEFVWRGQETSVALPGRMNVANALMAAEAALLLGLDEPAVAAGLASARPVSGRMETVGPSDAAQPVVVVDYSHTPDSIERALATLRATLAQRPTQAGETKGSLAIVFGCGGDRDRLKRPLMGRAAEQGADRVYLTSDNPRTEDPQAIIDDALAGFESPKSVLVDLDRRQAIRRAIIDSGPGDVVLIAGKGHEKTQTIGAQKLPFDDVEIALEILKALDT